MIFKNFKYYISIIVCNLSILHLLMAQRDIHFTQFNFQPLLINPALSGYNSNIESTLAYKKQWIGLQNAPSYSAFTIHSPILHGGGGVGLQLTNQSFGKSKQNTFLASFAYKIRINKGTLAIGIETGFRQYSLNVDDLIIENSNDFVLEDVQQIIQPDLGLGLYYQTQQSHLGITAKKLIGKQYTIDYNLLDYNYYSLYYLKKFNINQINKIYLSTFVNFDSKSPILANSSINYLINNGLRLGIAYKTSNELGFIVGFKINKLFQKIHDDYTLGYAFNQSLSTLSNVNNGTHEILLTYNFSKKPNPNQILKQKKAIHPIFF